ncbi:MAG TPA: hypothetical protein VIL48_00095 [Acidimicrobiales bacterium]
MSGTLTYTVAPGRLDLGRDELVALAGQAVVRALAETLEVLR